MRVNLLAIATLVCAACGVPDVDVPESNNAITSEAPATELPAPALKGVPKTYPYQRLALRGIASNGARVIVRGAGNPQVANVVPLENSFCVVVELTTSPAQYSLVVQSQAQDGRLSEPTEIIVTRQPDAPAPTDLELCDGSTAS